MGSITEGMQSLVAGLQKRKERRQNESTIDFFESKSLESIENRIKQAGDDQEAVSALEKQKKTMTELFEVGRKGNLSASSTIAIGKMIDPNFLQDVQQQIKLKAQEAGAMTFASEQAKLSPEIVSGQLVKRGLEKAQDLDFKLEEVNKLDEKTFGTQTQRFERSGDLRGEFVKSAKDFEQVRDAYAKLTAAVKTPSAVGDLALVFNFMKIIDPGSTVREGEKATAENARGVPDAARNVWNKLLTGETLPPNQRQDFVNQSKSLFDSQAEIHKKRITQFTGLAQRAGVDPADVILDLTLPESAKANKSGTLASGVKYEVING